MREGCKITEPMQKEIEMANFFKNFPFFRFYQIDISDDCGIWHFFSKQLLDGEWKIQEKLFEN